MELSVSEKLRMMYEERCKGKAGRYSHNTAMWPFLPMVRALTLQCPTSRCVIELGVHAGQSTCTFLLALLETGGRLWSCDLQQPLPPIAGLRPALDDDHPGLWTFVRGDAMEMALLDDLDDRAPPKSCDMLLVDAAFENRYVDLIHYGMRVRPGGIILVHDTNEAKYVRPQVEQYLALGDPSRMRVTFLDDNHGMAVIHIL